MSTAKTLSILAKGSPDAVNRFWLTKIFSLFYWVECIFLDKQRFAIKFELHRFAMDYSVPHDTVIFQPSVHYESTGLKMIKEGKVALVCLAGGQGSRLGFDGPKGCYEIAGKSLFEHQASRLKLLKPTPPLYIMTSDGTHADTVAYFENNGNFGLHTVKFFKQTSLPAFSVEGRAPIPTSNVSLKKDPFSLHF